MSVGGPELLILLAIVVLVFGAGWLPKAAKNLGRAKVELDRTKQQLNDTKQQVIEATGIDHVESTVRKANRALNTTPQGLLKSAAASALKPTGSEADPVAGQAVAGQVDDGIEDAEIVARGSDATEGDAIDTPEVFDATTGTPDTNITVDFNED